MNDVPQTVLPPEPWYKSEVQVRAVIAVAAQIVSLLLRAVGRYTDIAVTSEMVDAVTADLSQLVAFIFGGLAILKRKDSKIQPLTLTKKAAEERANEVRPVLSTDPTKPQAGFARPLMLALLLALSVVASSVLTGCESLGVEKAQNLDQRIAYAYGTHTGVQRSAAAALRGGLITKEDARDVLDMADDARRLLDSAKQLQAVGDAVRAGDKLTLATAVLDSISAYIDDARKRQQEKQS